MNLTREGNLILVNDTGGVVWQSFDHITDTWLLPQTLQIGQTLTSRQSIDDAHNFSQQFYASVHEGGLHAFVDTNPPTAYAVFHWMDYSYLKQNHPVESLELSDAQNKSEFTYLRLEPDGHLHQFKYIDGNEELILDSFYNIGNCSYPTTCGNYGICFSDNSCNCPEDDDDQYSNPFKLVDPTSPDLGCKRVIPLSCQDTHKHQTYVRLENINYFGFESFLRFTEVDADTCKRACLESCSCVAALCRYGENISSGDCSLPSQLLTLMHVDSVWNYNYTSFIKVQGRPETGKSSSSLVRKLVPSVSVSFLVLILCTGACYYTSVMRRADKFSSDLVIDTTRFSFDTLRVATHDFKERLGRGGFGSVFEGTLEDGKKVAVKCLDSVGQGRKEFLAEVTTIGTLHHFNLVKLIGFCEEGLQRLLVYEYMQNGLLDKWIFSQDLARSLTWS